MTFDYIEVEKRKFQCYTNQFCLHVLDTSRIFLSNNSSDEEELRRVV